MVWIWEFGYIQFLRGVSMLRMRHTNDDLEEFFIDTDEEFEVIESVIKNALEIIDVYEKLVESSDLK